MGCGEDTYVCMYYVVCMYVCLLIILYFVLRMFLMSGCCSWRILRSRRLYIGALCLQKNVQSEQQQYHTLTLQIVYLAATCGTDYNVVVFI